MKRQTLVVSVAAALSVALVFGVSAAVANNGNGNGNGNGGNGQLKPRVLANKQCHAEKRALQEELGGKLGNQAFKGKYGKHAMRECKREQTDEVQAEAKNAAQECKAEQADANFGAGHGGATFEEFYGTNDPNDNGVNGNDQNAFGKCVSGKVRAEQAEDLEQLENAAKKCKAERSDPDFAAGHGGESFADFYGTNHNKKTPLGKCVSQKAHEAGEEEGTTS